MEKNLHKKFLVKTASLRKCLLKDCGKKFTFEVPEYDMSNIKSEKQRFNGKCCVCFKSLMLNGDEYHKFQHTFGKPNLVLLKSTYDEFF